MKNLRCKMKRISILIIAVLTLPSCKFNAESTNNEIQNNSSNQEPEITSNCNENEESLVLEFTSGIKVTYPKNKSGSDGQLLHFEIPSSVFIESSSGKTEFDYASEPQLSPDRNHLLFINPLLWEEGNGDIYCYNDREKKISILYANEDPFNKPKELAWADNTYYLAVIGYRYGTATIGGNLYLMGNEQIIKDLYPINKNQEIYGLSCDGITIQFSLSTWDENRTVHTDEKVTVLVKDVL